LKFVIAESAAPHGTCHKSVHVNVARVFVRHLHGIITPCWSGKRTATGAQRFAIACVALRNSNTKFLSASIAVEKLVPCSSLTLALSAEEHILAYRVLAAAYILTDHSSSCSSQYKYWACWHMSASNNSRNELSEAIWKFLSTHYIFDPCQTTIFLVYSIRKELRSSRISEVLASSTSRRRHYIRTT
jgi:hypothetical protein